MFVSLYKYIVFEYQFKTLKESRDFVVYRNS